MGSIRSMRTMNTATPTLRRYAPRHSQRGAASLLVVMVLFFAISLVAAYTSRNLIYEQRTSANQYRSTLAFEAADAGAEWATAQLNEARMTDNCVPLPNAGAVSSGSPQPTFRERYVSMDLTTGMITTQGRLAGCVFNGSDWVCDCPASGEPSLGAVATTGSGPFPAFWVRFEPANPTPGATQPPGVIAARVNACTRNDPACLRFNREAQSGDGVASTWVALALKSALLTPPAAALTVRGNITAVLAVTDPTAAFLFTNTDRASGGFTMISGNFIDTPNSNLSIRTIPGTPDADSVASPDSTFSFPDLTLTPSTPANAGADRMFSNLFGTWPGLYSTQPAVNRLVCTAACTAAQVNNVMRWRPGRAVYLAGAGGLTLNAPVGTATEPVLLISEGPVVTSAASVTVYGLIYMHAAAWTTSGTTVVQGAVVSDGNLRFEGVQTINYDPSVLTRLQRGAGSFVRIPGGWRDFQP
jgi:hypothetical protein